MTYPNGTTVIYIETTTPFTETNVNSELGVSFLDRWVRFHPFNRSMEYRHAETNHPGGVEYTFGGNMSRDEMAIADIIAIDESSIDESESGSDNDE